MGFGSSCGMFSSEDSKPTDGLTGEFKGAISDACQNSQRCKVHCNNLFVTKSLLKKCLDQTTDRVSKLHAALSAMEKGNWSSIKAEHLQIVIDFDEDLWPKYASVNNRELAHAMIKWVANESKVAAFLKEDQRALRNAFLVLGTPGNGEKDIILRGMKKDVDLEKEQTFFEVSALKKNDNAFQAGHEILKEECEKRKSCIKRLYCDVNQTVVFAKLNELGLGGDADDGESLHDDEC